MESEYGGTCDQAELKTLLNELEMSCKMQEKEAKYYVMKLQEENLKVKQILSKISLLVKSVEQKGNIEDYQALYKKAIEEREEYKLKAHNQAYAITKLERELCKLKNCTLDNKNICSNSASYLDKEIDFLHTENASLRNELKCLKNQLNDQEHLKKELSDSNLENITLKEQIVKKQTELMEMHYQFDTKLKKMQTEYEQNTSNLQKKLSECQEQLTEAKISKELIESNLKEKYACALSKVKEMQQKLEKIINNGNEERSITDFPSNKCENSIKMENDFAEPDGSEQTKITTVITTTRSSSSTITTTEKVLKTSYSSENSPEETGTNRNCKIKLKKGVAVCLLDNDEQSVVQGGQKSDERDTEDLSEEEVDEICTLL